MASHDLTYTIAAHLDRHMVLPLLEFAQEKELYDRDDLLKAKLQLVSGTKMLDFAQEEYKALHKTDVVPPEMQQQRQQVYAQLEDWKQACLPLLQVIVDVELVKELKANNQLTYDYLSDKYKVNEEMLSNLYRFAKLTFDCGSYRDAADYLFYFRLLSGDEEKRFWALWGMLAAEILMTNWDAALEYLNTLRDAVDMRSWVSGPEQLQQRTWLIHWSLFIFFNIQDGRQAMIDFLFNDRLVSTIQNNCPHILRYLTVAVIINRRRKNSLKDLIRVLRQVDAEHRDPITQFLLSLYIDFDFEAAAARQKEAEALLSLDFFLGAIKDEFIEQARILFFETLCRIHKSIDMKLLARLLDFGNDPERKVVDLIRTTRTDAKIDSDRNQLIMGGHYPSVYQQVIDKTRNISYRTNSLAQQVEKRYQQENQFDD